MLRKSKPDFSNRGSEIDLTDATSTSKASFLASVLMCVSAALISSMGVQTNMTSNSEISFVSLFLSSMSYPLV